MSTCSAIPLLCAPTNVAGLLRSIQQVMEPQAAAVDVTLNVQMDNGVPEAVFVDGRKIAWALTTLIGTALRYVRHGTPRMPGGAIVVRATCDPATSDTVLEVQDDGPGISEQNVRRLTEDDTDDARGVLALAMIRDVVKAHGGRFEISSRTDAAGHGTTMRLTLPAA